MDWAAFSGERTRPATDYIRCAGAWLETDVVESTRLAFTLELPVHAASGRGYKPETTTAFQYKKFGAHHAVATTSYRQHAALTCDP